MDNNLQNSEYVIEGKLLEHPSAYQVAFDTVNKKHYNYRSIIITKIIKASGLKIGDVIQVAKDFSQIRGGERAFNYVNHSVPLMMFLNKSNILFFNGQYSNLENVFFAPRGCGILESGVKNNIKNDEISFDTAYQFLKKKYKIIIKDSFDISNPVKYNEILKRVNAKLGTNHPLKETEKAVPIEIKKVEPIIIENAKPTYSPRELEFIKEHDRLFKEYQQYQLDSAKTPGLKWKPNRTKILNG